MCFSTPLLKGVSRVTVSALFEPWGSIFQNGFLGGVKFKSNNNLFNFLPIFDLGVVLEYSMFCLRWTAAYFFNG